jgi:hypothetical protein
VPCSRSSAAPRWMRRRGSHFPPTRTLDAPSARSYIRTWCGPPRGPAERGLDRRRSRCEMSRTGRAGRGRRVPARRPRRSCGRSTSSNAPLASPKSSCRSPTSGRTSCSRRPRATRASTSERWASSRRCGS